jgi:glycosyltransferase involved in cell wall biosynthesis
VHIRVTLFHVGFPEYTVGLANALSSHAEVTLVFPRNFSQVCVPLANAAIRLLPFDKPAVRRDPRNLLAIRHAFELIHASRPDVLHVQETFDYAYDLYSLFARFPALVTTIHDVVPHPGDGHQAPGLQYSKAITCWRSSQLIVHTEGMKQQLAKRFRISGAKIGVIPHGELGSLYKKLAHAAGLTPLPREPHTILFFGRIWAYKGLRYLLDAFEILMKRLPDARLIIAGKGGDLDAHQERIRALSQITVLKHFIPAEQVAGLFEQSSVVVLPYIEASQSGVSAIGFTTGTVVVASRVGGLADQMSDQHTGLLVEPRNPTELADTLLAILEDQQKQERIREEAQALGLGQLSWENIACKTFEIYQRALVRRTPVEGSKG